MSNDQKRTAATTDKAPAAAVSTTSTATSSETSSTVAETKPAGEKPAETKSTSLPATTPTGESPKAPQFEKLPDDRWPLNRQEPVDPKGDAELSAEQVTLVDKGVAFLLMSKDHWKMGVPEPLSAWTTLRELLPSGTRAQVESDIDLSALRRLLSDQIICRIYPGITSKERLLVIRCVGTNFRRMEIIPWTLGK